MLQFSPNEIFSVSSEFMHLTRFINIAICTSSSSTLFSSRLIDLTIDLFTSQSPSESTHGGHMFANVFIHVDLFTLVRFVVHIR